MTHDALPFSSSVSLVKRDSTFKRNVPLNREDWLTQAIAELDRRAFRPAGYTVPANIRTSCSWPSHGGSGGVLGQCWDPSVSRDGVFEIYITPRLDDPAVVLPILAHEVVHAVVGLKCGHRGPFRTCALAIGLEGRMTSTVAGEAFKRLIDPIVEALGRYPHGALDPSARRNRPEQDGEPGKPDTGDPVTSGPKRQKGRMRKATCTHCLLTLRVTAKWLRGRALGCPDMACPGHDDLMHIE